MAANNKANTKAVAPKPHVALTDGDYDRLTGAFTKKAIQTAAETAIGAAAGGENIAVGYVGVDHFHLLQEFYGSLVTDHILREIAHRIQGVLRPQDSLGRFERDEFMIVFRELGSKFETLALASKIRSAIAEPIAAGGDEVELSPGCGIAQYPANGKSVHELHDFAANAMRTLLVAMRHQNIVAAQEKVTAARAAVDAAQAALDDAEKAYEEALALVAASTATHRAVHELELDTEV
jgi:diguanylate cyclase (GGDEF)-like protein